MRVGARLDRIWLGAIIVAASAIYTYVKTFSHFHFYDDEGFLMASVKSYLDGAVLYDQTPTLYSLFYNLPIAYPVRGSQEDWAMMLLIPATILNLASYTGSALALRLPAVFAGLRKWHC